MTRKEAITAIRCFMRDLTDGCQEALMVAIPELVESEDERIREKIIGIVKAAPFDEEKDVLLDWLEKQKKQNPRKFKIGDKVHWHDDDTNVITITGFWDDAYLTDSAYGPILFCDEDNWERIEQKTAEWNGDYNEEELQTRFAFYTYKDEPSVIYLSNVFVEETSRNRGFGTRILRAAEKVAETLGATTISLKVKRDSPANSWYRKNGYDYVTFEGEYDWLEKTLKSI